jgi:hypothetical protein
MPPAFLLALRRLDLHTAHCVRWSTATAHLMISRRVGLSCPCSCARCRAGDTNPRLSYPNITAKPKVKKVGRAIHSRVFLVGLPIFRSSLSSWRLPCAVSSVEAALMTVALHSPGCGRNLHRQRYNREAVYKMGSHGPTRAGSGRLPPHLKLCDVVLTSDSRNGCCVTFWVRRPIRMYVDGMRA